MENVPARSPSLLSNPFLIAIVVVAALFFGWKNWPKPAVTPIDNSDAIRILMVGNSLTKYNDLCRLLGTMARESGKKAFVVEHTILGSRLSQHWPRIEFNQLLDEQRWDFIVLQEQSMIPAYEDYRAKNMVPIVEKFDAKAREIGATTVLFMTWGFRNGAKKRDPALKDYETMQSRITDGFETMGRQMDIVVAPVGLAWQEVVENRPDIDLFHKDGFHPGPKGSYLAACVFYAFLFGDSPEGIEFYENVPPAEAKYLQQIAANLVANYQQPNEDISESEFEFTEVSDSTE